MSKALNLAAHYIIAIVTLDAIFGYITLLQATFTVAITFFGFNLQSAFVRYFFEKKIKHIFDTSFPILLFLFIASLVITFIALIYIDVNNPYYYFSLLPVIGFIHGVVGIISILSRSNYDLVTFAISSLLRPLFVFILAIILIFVKFN
ncbi:hypothetical protein QL982_14415, partial [Psychrobacter sp. 5A.1]|uniref:hypothetical protein n=1 Tax=Psychrobacter sp. 5A.1 TaxID=3035207 RepID=UPI0025B59B56